MFHLYAFVCMAALFTTGHATLQVRIDTKRIVNTVQDNFLSVTLDTYLMQDDVRWGTFDFKSEKLRTLLRGLSPAIVRVGGTPADFVLFDVTKGKLNQTGVHPGFVIMTRDDWDNLVNLTRSTGNRLLFDLNLQLRYGSQWDPSNAMHLFDYSEAQGYGVNIDFELGNEPGLYGILNFRQSKVDGKQIGRDFRILNKLLKSYGNFQNSSIVGPDIMVGVFMLKDFLSEAGPFIKATTVHHYYFSGRSATYKDYIDWNNFFDFRDTFIIAKSFIKTSKFPDTPLWLGETSDARDSGTPGVSDRFVSGFLWLDKLGVAAKLGLGVVMRQTFYGHNYGLLDKNLDPNPDYWLSWIYKTLVGPKVLSVTTEGIPNEVRGYAHCAGKRSGYPQNTLVFIFINVNQQEKVPLQFQGEFQDAMKHVFLFRPDGPDRLLSKSVSVNGKLMKLENGGDLPIVDPMVVPETVVFPPLSFGFVVFPNITVPICDS